MKLSIVTTLYSSAPYIEEFYRRISKAARNISEEYEIIFVNDGSPDDSLDRAIGLHEREGRITVIDLTRNFGHHKAIMTGLAHARGEYVFLIDSDLEEEPESLEEFWREMHRQQDVDLVYGVQTKRKGDWFERTSGALFFTVFNAVSDVKIANNVTIARLMTDRYVRSLTAFKESEVAFAGISVLAGYKQLPLPIRKGYKGRTTYSMKRKVDMAINFIVSFSSKPLLHIFYLGVAVTVVTFLYVLYLLLAKLFFYKIVDGWTSIMASIWLLAGLIMFSIGTVGIYLSKIFIEVKNRPYTIIKNIYSSSRKNSI